MCTSFGTTFSLKNMHLTFPSKQMHRFGHFLVQVPFVFRVNVLGKIGFTEITSSQRENNHIKSHNNSSNFIAILYFKKVREIVMHKN